MFKDGKNVCIIKIMCDKPYYFQVHWPIQYHFWAPKLVQTIGQHLTPKETLVFY